MTINLIPFVADELDLQPLEYVASGAEPASPISLSADSATVAPGAFVTLSLSGEANAPVAGAGLAYRPAADGAFEQLITDAQGRAVWRAPSAPGVYVLTATDGAAAATITITVAVPRADAVAAAEPNRTGFALSRQAGAVELEELGAKTFDETVSDAAAALQASSSRLLDLSIGSVLRALLESDAAQAMWLQGLVLNVLAKSRASTAAGLDLDTWVADFGLARLDAVPARGLVTLSRFTAGQVAHVPAGSIVETADGFQRFAVLADTAISGFDADQAAYRIEANATGITVPVQALATGASGNALAGTVTVIASSIPGVDTVTNAAPLTNGADAESDDALRVRFHAHLANLSKATKPAIGFAITSMRPGAAYSLVENEAYDGTPDLGAFYVVVDDGTGSPSAEFLSSAYNAVDAVRPVGTRFAVYAPTAVVATVALSVTIAPGFDAAGTREQVRQAVLAHIGRLGLGQSLYYTRLAQVAYEASPGVRNVASVTLNGGTADLAATVRQVVRAGSVTVS